MNRASVIRVGLVTLLFCSILQDSAFPVQESETSRSIRIVVTDLADQPIVGAKIHSSVWTDDKDYQANQDFVTDDNGVVVIPLPQQMDILRLWARKDGLVPLFANYGQEDIDQVPDEHRFQLQEGQEIGGTIVNEQGEPISGALVEVRRDKGGTKRDPNPRNRLGTWLANGEDALVTDENGRWQISGVPTGDDLEIEVLLDHPNYIKDEYWGGLQNEQFVTTDMMIDKSATIAMKSGVSVTGVVADPKGNPVADALVVWSDRPYMQTGSQEVKTDGNGVYHLPPQPEGKINLTVVAENWMPQLKPIEIENGMSRVNFQLDPGKALNLRFVDTDGNPVPEVYVGVREWRGISSLYNHSHANVINSKIPRQADDKGIYQWSWAPDDAVKFSIGKPEWSYLEQELIADGSEQTIVLYPALRIAGNVTDGKTGQLVKQFDVVPATVQADRPDRIIMQRHMAVPSDDGSFDYKDTYFLGDRHLLLQIEAAGYRAKRIGPFDLTRGHVIENVEMQPAEPLRGRVLSPGGKPVEGAKLFCVTKDDSFIVDSADYEVSEGGALSDEAGNYVIPAPMFPPVVIAAHEQGYTELTLQLDEQPGDLVLKPWSRVEGTLFQDGQPVPGANIYLNPIRMLGGDNQHVQDRFSAKTNRQGQFVFDRVPPVPSSVSAFLSVWRECPITSSQSVPLDLKPGETHTVNLGGDGISITGRVQPAGELAEKIDMNYCLNYLLKNSPGIEPPTPVAAAGFNWQDGWSFDWTCSTQGSAFLQSLPYYFVKFQSDGSFTISGVPQGKYQFATKIYEPPTGCLIDPVGIKLVDVNVGSEDVARGHLDIGTIDVEVSLGPQIGEAFPDFRFDTLVEEQTGQISQYRGKYVLVDFWATWCAPCIKALPEVQRLHGELANRDDFVVLSVSLDDDSEVARNFIREKKISWQQGLLGTRDNPLVRKQLGISSVPLYCIVDPEGNLVFRGYEFVDAENSLRGFLGLIEN